jgi:LuxR family transcriptional regulator, quorum-sensing system regulator SdiA
MELNAEFNVHAGFVGSLKGVVPGMGGVIGLSPIQNLQQNEANELWAQVGEDIELLSKLMHLRISSLPQNGQRRPLTTRQREALQWYSRGKTMQDIAAIMGVSIATVEKHLRMVREALDAQTTAHAVQKATALNLLNNDD